MNSFIRYEPYRRSLIPKTARNDEEYERLCTEYNKVIATDLRRAEGMFNDIFYNYQGFWYPEWHCKAIMLAQTHFKSLGSDILLASCPKSGTTWVKALIFAVVHRRSTSHEHPLLHHNPHDLMLFLELDLYGNKQICEFDDSFPVPRLFSTHLPYTSLPESVKDSGCRIVYICRNLKDTFVSFWHFLNNNPATKGSLPELKLEEFFEMYAKGVIPWGSHWDQILSYWRARLDNPERILFLKYEQLRAEPAVELKKLAAFLGFPFAEDEEKDGVVEEILRLCSFENMVSLEVNKTGSATCREVCNSTYFRKGRVNDWENYLTPEMIKQFDSVTEEKFRGSGLTL